jgi:hypothetical protein
MNELVNPLAVDKDTARTVARTVRAGSRFRNKRDFGSNVEDLIATLTHTEAAIDNVLRNPNSGMLFDGGAIAAGSRLMAEALSPAEMQAVTRETIGYAHTHIGLNAAGVMAGAVPGCGQRV